ncbi:MAG: helix-turn-helix domain-containing protein [Acidiferrobacterales bacterium]
MSNAALLVNVLKKALKAHGLTYRDVAMAVDLSEASVKRLFSEQHFTLERLEQICRLMDITISGLVKMADADTPHIRELTNEQEEELVSDKKLLFVAVLVLNNWAFEEILEDHTFSEPELIRCLARLTRLKLIELLPKNRIKLLIAPNFRWREHGPIQRFFTENVKNEYLQSPFNRSGELFMFQYGMLSNTSNAVIQKRFQQVVKEFNDLHQADLGLPLSDRYGRILVLGIRSWALSAFEEFRHTESEPS